MQFHKTLSGIGSFVTDDIDHGDVSYRLNINYNRSRHSIAAGGSFRASDATVAHAFHARQPTCLRLEDGRRIDVAISATGGVGEFVVCKPQVLEEALDLGRAIADARRQ